jgi:hypothetical protein
MGTRFRTHHGMWVGPSQRSKEVDRFARDNRFDPVWHNKYHFGCKLGEGDHRGPQWLGIVSAGVNK